MINYKVEMLISNYNNNAALTIANLETFFNLLEKITTSDEDRKALDNEVSLIRCSMDRILPLYRKNIRQYCLSLPDTDGFTDIKNDGAVYLGQPRD